MSFYCFNFKNHPNGWSPQAFGWIAHRCHVESVTFEGWESKAFGKIDRYEIWCVIPKISSIRMHDYVMHGKCKLQVLDHEIDLLENKVCQFCVGCACLNS